MVEFKYRRAYYSIPLPYPIWGRKGGRGFLLGPTLLFDTSEYFFLSFLDPITPESSMNFCRSYNLTCQSFTSFCLICALHVRCTVVRLPGEITVLDAISSLSGRDLLWRQNISRPIVHSPARKSPDQVPEMSKPVLT